MPGVPSKLSRDLSNVRVQLKSGKTRRSRRFGCPRALEKHELETLRVREQQLTRRIAAEEAERLRLKCNADNRHLTELERALTEVVCRTAAKAKHVYQKRKWSPGAKQSEKRVPESSGKLLTPPTEIRELVDIREAPCINQDSFRFI